MKLIHLAVILALSINTCVFAKSQPKNEKPTSTEPAATQTKLTLPGVTADRASGYVSINATATGLKKGEACEFLLITSNSGHDYEAFAISKASATDIAKAMAFLEIKPGQCIDYQNLRFWPKGERTIITFQAPKDKPVRAERLMLDTRTDKTLPETGFVFTGSFPKSNNNKSSSLIADDGNPGSIISGYNEATTVFDVPHLAQQDQSYGNIVPNPEHLYEAGTELTIRIEPELKNGKSRILDLTLNITPSETSKSKGVEGLSLALADQTGKVLNTNGTGLNSALKTLSELTGKEQDVFLQINLADNVLVKQMSALSRILQSIENPNGVRIEPPGKGMLYYKAFIPDPEFLNRKTRIMHPWELHLKKEENKIAGILTQTRNEWLDESMVPEIRTTDFSVASGEDMRKIFDADIEKSREQDASPNIRVLLIIVKNDLNIGEVMSFIGPVLNTHGTVHVFTEEIEQRHPQRDDSTQKKAGEKTD